MADISRDSDTVEIDEPPRFAFGERVLSRSVVRNDGTFPGKDLGDILVQRGDVGYVRTIGTFLQQYYIYGVEWIERGYQVGMRAKELCTLDDLPPEILRKFSDRLAELRAIGRPMPARGQTTADTLLKGAPDDV
jgi:nitrogen fixation protein NifZ